MNLIPCKMGLVARKSVLGVSAKASYKPVSSATENSWKIEISPVASLDMILSKKRITKALIRLCGCAGWSVPVLFANPPRQIFPRRGPNHSIISAGQGFWVKDSIFMCFPFLMSWCGISTILVILLYEFW